MWGSDHISDVFVQATSAAGLTKEHLALLEEHGYMHVPHMPGYVLEPDSRGYRELSLEDGSIRSHQPGDLRLRVRALLFLVLSFYAAQLHSTDTMYASLLCSKLLVSYHKGFHCYQELTRFGFPTIAGLGSRGREEQAAAQRAGAENTKGALCERAVQFWPRELRHAGGLGRP